MKYLGFINYENVSQEDIDAISTMEHSLGWRAMKKILKKELENTERDLLKINFPERVGFVQKQSIARTLNDVITLPMELTKKESDQVGAIDPTRAF